MFGVKGSNPPGLTKRLDPVIRHYHGVHTETTRLCAGKFIVRTIRIPSGEEYVRSSSIAIAGLARICNICE